MHLTEYPCVIILTVCGRFVLEAAAQRILRIVHAPDGLYHTSVYAQVQLSNSIGLVCLSGLRLGAL